MKKEAWRGLIVALVFTLATGCGGGDEDDGTYTASSPQAQGGSSPTANTPNASTPNASTPNTGATNPQVPGLDQIQQTWNDPSVEAVEGEDLKALFPSSVAGLDRVEASSQTTGAFGFKMSNATARYQDDDARITVTITDAGSMKQAVAAANVWMMSDFNKTNDRGYERTATIEGYRGMEKFESRSNGTTEAEVSVFVADRFVVNVKGRNVEMDDVKEALEDLKLRKLGRMD